MDNGNGIVVSKFGGAVLADSEKIKKSIEIIKSDPARRYIIISAPGKRSPDDIKMTDMLYLCHSQCMNRENFMTTLNEIQKRFEDIVQDLGVNFRVDAEIADIKKNLFLGRDKDYIASRGEYILSKIIAQYLGWKFIDAADLIFFNSNGKLDENKTFETVASVLKHIERAVIPGFYGVMGKKIKVFSRGGGDISGAIIARAVKAERYEKWRERTKVFSADPNLIPNPEVIRNLTYTELRELTHMGIEVIDSEVIFFLQGVKVPINIRSIYHPDDTGTFITDTLPENSSRKVAACIAGRSSFRFIHIDKFGLNKTHGIGEKVFGTFAKYGISCEHYISGIYNFAVAIKNPIFDLRRNEILKEIKDKISPENITVETNLSVIAVIGSGVGTVKGIFAKIFNAIAAADVKVHMINQGAGESNIIIGVYDEDFEKTIKALYEAMILH